MPELDPITGNDRQAFASWLSTETPLFSASARVSSITSCRASFISTGGNLLRKFGALLGVLYHGCDDVGDVKGLESLGGGGEEDLRDGILTLPASIAIKDPIIAELFCKSERLENELGGSAGRGGALGPTGGRGEVGGTSTLRESRASVCSCGPYQGAIAPLA